VPIADFPEEWLWDDVCLSFLISAGASGQDWHTKKGRRLCEANFYTAEYAILRGKKDKAPCFFRLARKSCPRISIEWTAAQREMEALGADQDSKN